MRKRTKNILITALIVSNGAICSWEDYAFPLILVEKIQVEGVSMSRKKHLEQSGKMLGPHIYSRRKELRMSREDLAEKLQITADYLGKLERGEQTPSYDLFVAIAIALDVSEDYLSQDSPGVNPKYALQGEMAKAIIGDNDNDIRFYLKVIEEHHIYKQKMMKELQNENR